jgi:hypothetical protein
VLGSEDGSTTGFARFAVRACDQLGGRQHYRIRALCHAPRTHDKGQNLHGTAFAVRILPGRTAKGAQRILARQRPFRAPWGKATHGIALCHAQYVMHGKERGLMAVRGETMSHSLHRAPLRTHGTGSTFCRASHGAAHGKGWSRRMVDQALGRASCGAAHDKEWSRRMVDHALCRASFC